MVFPGGAGAWDHRLGDRVITALVVCLHRRNWARKVKPKPLESWCFVPSEWRAVEVTWAGSGKSEVKGSSCNGSGV